MDTTLMTRWLVSLTLAAGPLAACSGELGFGGEPEQPARGPDGGGRDVDGGGGADLGAAAPEDMGGGGGGEELAEGPWRLYLDPDYDPNGRLAGKQEELFSGGDPEELGAITVARMRRIERLEWVRNTGRWTTTRSGGGSRAEQNPFEISRPHGYSTYRQRESLNKDMVAQYFQVLPGEASFAWSARPSDTGKLPVSLRDHPSYTCMLEQEGGGLPEEGCVDDFARLYLREAVYFRPPTEEEVEALASFGRDILSETPQGSYDAQTRRFALEAITSAAWMTVPALFHSERGDASRVDDRGRVPLSDWELAHAVSHALGRKAPGAPAAYIHHGGPGERRVWAAADPAVGHLHAIEQAALDGTISDRAALAALIREAAAGVDEERMDLPVEWFIVDARRKRGEYWVAEGIERFFREWLEVDAFATKFKDTSWETSKYERTLDSGDRRRLAGSYEHLRTNGSYSSEPLYIQQLDDMIARIVAEDEQVFEKLMTSRTFYTPSGQYTGNNNGRGQMPQYVYNIEDEHDGSRANRWRTLPADERAGVLTHPVWLGAHADNFENGTAIIYRGKWIRERLLCGTVPPVTGDIPAMLVPGEGKSGRQRVDESTAPAVCAGCHGLMNSLGKPFEIYNHAGFVRDYDHTGAPDGSSLLENMPAASGLDGVEVRDAVDFAQKLGASQYVRRCFIRQTFRYFMGRPETLADAYTLSQMEHTYEMTNGSFVEMLVTLMTSDAFLYRLPLSVLQPPEASP